MSDSPNSDNAEQRQPTGTPQVPRHAAHPDGAQPERRHAPSSSRRHTPRPEAEGAKRRLGRVPVPQVTPAQYRPVVGAPDAAQSANQPNGGRHHGGKRVRTHKPNFIARIISNWWDRLLDIVMEGKVDDQRDMYASHRTTRDYVWNSLGTGAWGAVFPLLTIVCTQLVGAEQAGMFSMAFVTGLLLMFLGNYGVRTYQLSDLNERHSFSDYQVNRVLTCIVMMIAGWAYCQIRGYDSAMFLVCMGVYSYKMIDALADVYEGRLQQMDKLYLAGISQALRSVVAIVVFSLFLFLTRNLAAASIAMAVAAAATFLVLTLPLAFLETPKSQHVRFGSVIELFRECFPLFIALFMYNLIDNMPKFVMEGVLSYDNQLYFNALYFPAHALLLTVQVVYKPQLVRIANVWAQAKRKRFDLIIIAMLLLVLGLTVALMAIMSTVGIPVLGFLYGLDFSEYRGLSLIMVAAGGVTAAIDFLYQIVTVLRKQGSVMKLYLVTFGFSLFIPILLINFTGLPGAVISYLIVMTILLVLLVWEYGRIRMQMSRERKERAAEEARRASDVGVGAAATRHAPDVRAEQSAGANGRAVHHTVDSDAFRHGAIPATGAGANPASGNHGSDTEPANGDFTGEAPDRFYGAHFAAEGEAERGRHRKRPSEVRAERERRKAIMEKYTSRSKRSGRHSK